MNFGLTNILVVHREITRKLFVIIDSIITLTAMSVFVIDYYKTHIYLEAQYVDADGTILTRHGLKK